MIEDKHVEFLLNVSRIIEDLVATKNLPYIDACIFYCEENDIEIEQLGDLLKNNENITTKIQVEAEDLNFLKKTNRFII